MAALTAEADRPRPMTVDEFRDAIDELLARLTIDDPAHFVHWSFAAGGVMLDDPTATPILVHHAQFQASYVTEGLLYNALDKLRGVGFEADCGDDNDG